MSDDPLTEREQHCLEHLRRAQELEVSLAEYARSFDLDVKELYSAKQALVRKGVFAARVTEETEPEAAQGSFVPVHVSPRRSAPTTMVCRIHHPSGLVIECTSLPPVSWVAALLSRGSDVPA
jgi:hypothetical protein